MKALIPDEQVRCGMRFGVCPICGRMAWASDECCECGQVLEFDFTKDTYIDTIPQEQIEFVKKHWKELY